MTTWVDETSWGPIDPAGPDTAAINYAAQMAHTGRVTTPAKKRKGVTPEAKVTKACDAYLQSIGALVIRTNSGSWRDDSGNVIMGARGGTSDKVICMPGMGRFVALELKAANGVQSEAQKQFQARVIALGGIYILARSVDELRAALVAAFGHECITDLETLGAARQRAKKAQLAALKKANGQG